MYVKGDYTSGHFRHDGVNMLVLFYHLFDDRRPDVNVLFLHTHFSANQHDHQ